MTPGPRRRTLSIRPPQTRRSPHARTAPDHPGGDPARPRPPAPAPQRPRPARRAPRPRGRRDRAHQRPDRGRPVARPRRSRAARCGGAATSCSARAATRVPSARCCGASRPPDPSPPTKEILPNAPPQIHPPPRARRRRRGRCDRRRPGAGQCGFDMQLLRHHGRQHHGRQRRPPAAHRPLRRLHHRQGRRRRPGDLLRRRQQRRERPEHQSDQHLRTDHAFDRRLCHRRVRRPPRSGGDHRAHRRLGDRGHRVHHGWRARQTGSARLVAARHLSGRSKRVRRPGRRRRRRLLHHRRRDRDQAGRCRGSGHPLGPEHRRRGGQREARPRRRSRGRQPEGRDRDRHVLRRGRERHPAHRGQQVRLHVRRPRLRQGRRGQGLRRLHRRRRGRHPALPDRAPAPRTRGPQGRGGHDRTVGDELEAPEGLARAAQGPDEGLPR